MHDAVEPEELSSLSDPIFGQKNTLQTLTCQEFGATPSCSVEHAASTNSAY